MNNLPHGLFALPSAGQTPGQHPEHAMLMEYWRARLDGTGLPPLRSSFDPADLRKLLPRLAVIEAIQASEDDARPGHRFRYRYRLTGEEIVSRSGRDPTGRCFDELYEGDYLDRAMALYDGIRESGQPHVSRNTYPVSKAGTGLLCYDRLILPARGKPELAQADQFLLLIVVVEQIGDFESRGSFWRARI